MTAMDARVSTQPVQPDAPRHFTVALVREIDAASNAVWYSSLCPGIPGGHSQGATPAEALAMAADILAELQDAGLLHHDADEVASEKALLLERLRADGDYYEMHEVTPQALPV